jgi:thioredoxin reductase (NADPH)
LVPEWRKDNRRAAKNIAVHEGVEIATVHGSPCLEAVTLRAYNPDSNSNDAKPDDPDEILRISPAFVFIGADPGCAWLPESIARDNLGYILTGVDALSCGRWPLKDREPCPLETTLPRVLAARRHPRRFYQTRRLYRRRRLPRRHVR